MHNKYLKERAHLRKMKDHRMQDSHYGRKMSRGFIGYETIKPSHDYRRDYEDSRRMRDSRDYKSSYDYRDSRDYTDYRDYGYDSRDYRDYRDSRSRRDSRDYESDMRDYNDYEDYDDGKMYEEYEKDLHHWAEKLKPKDKFSMSKEQIISHAKSMGIRFDRYSENEFYTTYLMMVSDYKELGSEPSFFVKMARDFLEDDDMAVSPSEKLCIYMYKIAMGE